MLEGLVLYYVPHKIVTAKAGVIHFLRTTLLYFGLLWWRLTNLVTFCLPFSQAITKGISVFSESLGKLATSSRQTAASSPPRTEASVENQTAVNTKNGYPGVVSVIDTMAIEGEVGNLSNTPTWVQTANRRLNCIPAKCPDFTGTTRFQALKNIPIFTFEW